ncbi:MAG TPA: DUF1156 domain-containing protein [Candidatus Paceibacterota bacterium]|nr:DUF1156 domain-containing protein [Candidatus Paceibacterota bacterium]HRZ91424.1 DUF1156 domain-containing protein [Candidatus Paceibacterota bacterium]
MNDYSRLIEHAFPLRQASIDSVHEKNVRHGHISTLHIWPARRPLAAARAALLATLLPDPGTPEARKELCEKIGGRLQDSKPDKEGRVKEETVGGILRWKRETDNKELLDWFRAEILKANGGRAPKVLDPFAGGGAIPLEAMRLGCDVTAADLNPVAWFILKCTLEYPQKLAGQKRSLPQFILRDREFMEEFFTKVHRLKGGRLRKAMEALGHRQEGVIVQEELNWDEAANHAEGEKPAKYAKEETESQTLSRPFACLAGISLEADLAWHVRAWGRKVLAEARKELTHLYPTYAEWQPLMPGKAFDPQPMRLLDPNENGVASADKLNAELGEAYLQDKFNPRWLAKPTVAYLWARTVTCKNCRATIPLLKTRWLCRKDNKRIRLLAKPNPERTGVIFSIEHDVPERGGNAAQKREHDKKLGAATMSRAGAQCPCCLAIMETEDIRYEGRNGRLTQTITVVVVDGLDSKEYRLPTDHERRMAEVEDDTMRKVFEKVPFGVPEEPTPKCGPGASRAFSVDQYGFDQWRKLFTDRQLLALGTFRNSAAKVGLDSWIEPTRAYMALAVDRLAEASSTLASWRMTVEAHRGTFSRFALPIVWDFTEVNPLSQTCGNFLGAVEWIAEYLEHALGICAAAGETRVLQKSALIPGNELFDVVITDPPYYDAIPYSDLMDFFYVWLRRTLYGLSPGFDAVFAEPLAPKWNHERNDGELIDDAARHNGDKDASKRAYEDGMARAFQACHATLAGHGRLVIVFAHKHPDAWETLVSAIIRAGFVVDGSWPIATERTGRTRSLASAALASSVWLVCRKRDPMAKVGWDNRVMAEMRENIAAQLREFWDSGIRGPDFVWAATGPAMEAYSKYPAVKKANSPSNEFLSVKEFLDAVRRIVIEFVVGRVLHIEAGTDRLDPVTAYYLLHRNDFGFQKAPAGACILYAVSCGVSDRDLEPTWNLITVKGSKESVISDLRVENEGERDEEAEGGGAEDEASGGEFILRTWKERKEKRMGYEAPGGREVPVIDRVHRLMHLWKDGDVRKVNDYLDDYALRRNDLFVRVIQSLIELSERGSEERVLLESLSSHLGAKAAKRDATMPLGLENLD